MTELLRAQSEYLAFAEGKPGVAAFMEMGMGKTLAVLTEFVRSDAKLGIIICPNTLKKNWAVECKKHGLPIQPWVWIRDRTVVADECDIFLDKQLYIFNIEAIRSQRTRDLIEAMLKEPGKSYMAFDESIVIASHDSAQTKAAIALSKKADYRRILSGKPTRSGPHDLWSQLRAVGHLDGVNYYAFRNRFCVLGGFKGKAVIGARNEDQLAELLAPVAFWARKEDYLDLPEKSYTKRRYKLNKQLNEFYQSMLNDFMLWLNEDKAVTVDAAIAKYEKMSQIQAGFIFDEDGTAHQLVGISDNPRLKALLDVLDETDGKVCIVYRHRPVLPMLLGALQDFQPSAITGGMTPSEIEENKRRFNEDPECRVMLLQINSAKYGHTLLADQASDIDYCGTMVFYENSYSLDDRSQTEDRIHRIGQKRAVLYVDLSGTRLDDDVTDALQRKESIFQAILTAVRGVNGNSEEMLAT